MQKSDYYHEIKTKSTITDDVFKKLLLYSNGWEEHYGFKAKRIPKDLWGKDKFINNLSKKYDLSVGILSVPTNSVFNWHTDCVEPCRKISINLLLTDSHSHCLFTDDSSVGVSNTLELHYQPETYYVLNVTKKHMIINLDKPRSIISITLSNKDKNKQSIDTCISYEEFLSEVESYESYT
jgi:hypothetical protein